MTNTKDARRAMESTLAPSSSATGSVTFSHVFGQQCQLMEAAVQSLHTLNDQISHFIVTKSKALEEDKDPFLPTEKETLKSSMILMRHLLMDAQSCWPADGDDMGKIGQLGAGVEAGSHVRSCQNHAFRRQLLLVLLLT
ncbi:putative uncharacterized protein C1orf196 [Ailuropoda melanoleuca]|uniref:putative uncharacterized protein C1orf196 n=1 Tax=Ailuropoda melanoleuca TaxID=9646 RepID=UPI001494AAD2|nr:putative uncharacterized protein C1orf196 [Ailuropoda melanoleuca]